MAFPISGWMILFGGSGCFLRWGYNCSFPNGARFKDRSYWQIADLAWLMKNPTSAYKMPPSYSQFSQEMMEHEGKQRRASLAAMSPFAKSLSLVSEISEYISMWMNIKFDFNEDSVGLLLILYKT